MFAIVVLITVIAVIVELWRDPDRLMPRGLAAGVVAVHMPTVLVRLRLVFIRRFKRQWPGREAAGSIAKLALELAGDMLPLSDGRDSVAVLHSKADMALYTAKAAGRNRVVKYDSGRILARLSGKLIP